MRWLSMLMLLASVFVGSMCANDDITASWILEAVKNQGGKPNLGTAGGSATTGTDEEGKRSKLDLTPTVKDSSVDCTTKDQQSGICVLYYQCDKITKTVIEDGVGLFDLRSSNCPHYLDVCCKIADVQTTGTKIIEENDANLDKSPNRNKEQGSVSALITTTPKGVGAGSNSVIPECGWSSQQVSHFVFPDKEIGKNYPHALHGDFPWMIAVLKKTDNSAVWSQSDYLGGGTLIHPSVVMTVAHKLTMNRKNYTATELKCRAGEWDTQTDLELYKHQERDVVKIIIHEAYYRTSLYNDVALLILEKPFQLKGAPHIGTGCLANALPPPGRVCYSMGWGRVDPKDKKKFANILKKVLLNTVEAETCQQLLRKTRLGNLFELHESLTCASGNAGEDSCAGDGGAPLVCAVSNDPQESRFAVHGMVVYGIECFNPQVPGVYANTVLLKSWIDTRMIEEGFDTTSYTI